MRSRKSQTVARYHPGHPDDQTGDRSDLASQMDFLGGIAALLTGTRWIVSERTSARYYSEIPVFARLRLLLGRFSSSIVANSSGGEQYWRMSARPKLRLATIPNALDIAAIREAGVGMTREINEAALLLVVGRFTSGKALEIIVRAIGKLSQRQTSPIDVLMMGEGDQRSSIVREIAEASLARSNQASSISVRLVEMALRGGWVG